MEFSRKGLLWTCRAGGPDETIARLLAGCSSPGGDKGSDPDTAQATKATAPSTIFARAPAQQRSFSQQGSRRAHHLTGHQGTCDSGTVKGTQGDLPLYKTFLEGLRHNAAAAVDPKLLVDFTDIAFGGVVADVELGGGLFGAVALDEELQDFLFAGG